MRGINAFQFFFSAGNVTHALRHKIAASALNVKFCKRHFKKHKTRNGLWDIAIDSFSFVIKYSFNSKWVCVRHFPVTFLINSINGTKN